jgi:hypothetical protein
MYEREIRLKGRRDQTATDGRGDCADACAKFLSAEIAYECALLVTYECALLITCTILKHASQQCHITSK